MLVCCYMQAKTAFWQQVLLYSRSTAASLSSCKCCCAHNHGCDFRALWVPICIQPSDVRAIGGSYNLFITLQRVQCGIQAQCAAVGSCQSNNNDVPNTRRSRDRKLIRRKIRQTMVCF